MTAFWIVLAVLAALFALGLWQASRLGTVREFTDNLGQLGGFVVNLLSLLG